MATTNNELEKTKIIGGIQRSWSELKRRRLTTRKAPESMCSLNF